MIQWNSWHLPISRACFSNPIENLFKRWKSRQKITIWDFRAKWMCDPLYINSVYAFGGNNCMRMRWGRGGLVICRQNECANHSSTQCHKNVIRLGESSTKTNEWKNYKNNYSIKIYGGVNQKCGNRFHSRCMLFKNFQMDSVCMCVCISHSIMETRMYYSDTITTARGNRLFVVRNIHIYMYWCVVAHHLIIFDVFVVTVCCCCCCQWQGKCDECHQKETAVSWKCINESYAFKYSHAREWNDKRWIGRSVCVPMKWRMLLCTKVNCSIALHCILYGSMKSRIKSPHRQTFTNFTQK